MVPVAYVSIYPFVFGPVLYNIQYKFCAKYFEELGTVKKI